MVNQKSFLGVAVEHSNRNAVCKEYRAHLVRTAVRMREAGIESMATASVDRINNLLDSFRGRPSTVAANRRMICTLIRAADGQRAGKIIDLIRKVKCPVPPPIAWSEKELSSLLAAVDNMTRTLNSGCPSRLFFRAWVLVGYYTGLRFGDQMGLRVNQLRDNRLFLVQNKTGLPIVKVLPAEVVQLLGALATHPMCDGTLFAWALKENWLRVWFRRLCKQAGITGTPKWLRRSGATACEAQSPGSATRYLGHRSPELALKYYVDASLLPNSIPSPPLLKERVHRTA